MKKSLLYIGYILSFILCCFVLNPLTFVNAQDAKIIQTADATIHITENIEKNRSSENEEKIVNYEPVTMNSDILEPSVDVEKNLVENNDKLDNINQQVVNEIVSQNSGIPNDIITNGSPVVLTLSDTASAELQQRAEISSQLEPRVNDQLLKNHSKEIVEQVPPLATQDLIEEPVDRSEIITELPEVTSEAPIVPKNLTETQDEIPSFSEWTQKKRLEEKEKEQVNVSVQGHQTNGNKQNSNAKLRWKNYASLDCGAKVIASNPEAISPWAILSPSRDEYKLNTCTSRIWFVVELCEAIQAKKIDLANYELFSSSPENFTVSVSDRFPSREWSTIGHFTAKDERDIQSFDLDTQFLGKYIKVEIKSHYGKEHYCPISLLRVYGTNVFEVLQKEDPGHENRIEDEDDDDEALETKGDSPGIFTSAKDAVISMVKKAAEVLGNKGNYTSETVVNNKSKIYTPLINSCTTPSHYVVCNNCSDLLFGQVYELLSCKNNHINNLVGIPFIKKVLKHSNTCQNFGFDFHNKTANHTKNTCSRCVDTFFPLRFLGAMCNTIAIIESKVVLNISHQYPNITQNITNEKIVNIVTPEVHITQKPKADEIKTDAKTDFESVKPTDPLVLEQTETKDIKIDVTNNTPLASKIKPTKTLSDVDMQSLNTDTNTKRVEPENVDTQQSMEAEPAVNKNKSEHIEIVIEKKEEATSESESIEIIEDNLETFINEINGESTQNVQNPASNSISTPPGQKESVFLRLSNRIKALEHNMSLSSQYLEELSRRYKKQVEEMQRLLEKTIVTLHEESIKKDERNKQLEERLDNLTAAVEHLLSDKNSWSNTIYWLFLTITIAVGIFTFCRRSARKHPDAKSPDQTIEVHRRQSIDVVNHQPPTKKKRRPSDQALKICRSATTAQENEKRLKDNKRKKKKNNRVVQRCNSINTLSEENDYSEDQMFNPRHNSTKDFNLERKNEDWVAEHDKIEDVPFIALDESENSTLEAIPVTEISKIDVPDFVETAQSRRLSRTGNSVPIKEKFKRKANSLDESKNKISVLSNGNGTSVSSSTEENTTPKKERRGFKKLFKKVF